MRTIIGNKTFYNRQNGAIGGHTSPGYLMKWGQTLFGFFTTRKEMEEWYLTVKADCFSKGEPFVPLEVIYDAQRCGFFADIECLAPLDMDADDVETLKSDIMVGVNKAYESRGLSSDALVWSENHRKQAEKGVTKISFHVVGRDVDFIGTDKNSDLGHVAKKMNQECRTVAEKYPLVRFSTCGKTRKNINVLDLAVYSRNRAMRTIYSSKEGSESSCFLPCAGFEDVPLSSWWIVRDVESQGVVHEEPWTDDDEKALSNVLGKALTAHTYDGRAFQSFIASASKTPSTADQRKLAERLQTYFRDLQQDPTITVKFYALYSKDGFSPKDAYRIDGTNRNCHPCGRTHTSNGGGILDLGEDRFLYRCFAGERAVAFSLGGESENVGGDVIPVTSGGESESIGEDVIPVTLVEPDDGRVPSILGRSEKVIHITAGMGSGKTFRVEEYIRENPESTVLYATCRISMATTIAGRMEHLGFKSYKDVPGTRINSCKRLVCEIESFHRLHRKYDVVVIDEARAVMSAVTSYETNGENLLINYDNLLWLSRESGKLVVMCADSNQDRAVDIFVEDVFRVDGGQKLIMDDAFMQLGEGVGQHSFATMFKKLQHQRDESIHRIEVKKPILQRKFIQASHDTAMAMMVRDVMEGQKVVVCVGSKKYMEATEENLKRKVTDRELKIRTYFADSPHKSELADINTHWQEFDVVMYTSTITVAIDYTLPVHRVYCFPDVFTSPPRDTLQGSGRSRDVTTGEVIVALPKRKEGNPETFYYPLPESHDMNLVMEAELEKILKCREVSGAMMRLMRSRMLRVDDGIWAKYLPTALTKIWACNLAEQTLKLENWYSHFFWMVKKKGYEWSIMDGSEDEVEEELDSIAILEGFYVTSSVDIGERERALLASIDVMSFNDNAEREIFKKKIAGTATEEQLATLKKYSVQKHFEQELNVDDIVTVLKKKRGVLNVCSMLKLSPEERDNYFVIATDDRMEQDFLSRDHLILRNMERLLEQLGYTGFGDRATTVKLEEVEKSDSVVGALRKVTDLAVGGRGPSSSIKAEISRILKSLIGLKLERVRVGRGSKRRSMYKIAEDKAVWRIAKFKNNFFGQNWKASKEGSLVALGKRKRRVVSGAHALDTFLGVQAGERLW